MSYPKIKRYRNGRIVTVTATDLDSNRVRFNWGYHDGASEARRNYSRPEGWQETHHDAIYVAGWNAGYVDGKDGDYTETSEPAWEASGIAHGFDPVKLPEPRLYDAGKGRKVSIPEN